MTAENEVKKVSIGLIGVGRIGRLHAENIRYRIPNAELVAISDIDVLAAKAQADKLGVKNVGADYSKILTDETVQAVVICSSTDTHAKMIEEAAAAGKHIFCEKPIDHELSKIDRALAAVDRANVKLQIGFNRRFDKNFRRIREAISQGEIGQPRIVRITSRDPAPPSIDYIKVSGGLFLDMTIHDFDMARYLTGSEISSVYAVGAAKVNDEIASAGDIDTAVITLEFSNGMMGTIDNSRQCAYGYDQRVEVFGSAGAVRAENQLHNTTLVAKQDGIRAALPLDFFLDRYADSYLVEMTEFVDAVRNDKRPTVTGRDGRVPVLVALAAMKSMKDRRAVKISEIDTLASPFKTQGIHKLDL
jgi:myo-inositol 2-dehydrogenase / D-chiro-inositol 1-dehydrogenase